MIPELPPNAENPAIADNEPQINAIDADISDSIISLLNIDSRYKRFNFKKKRF